MIIPGTVTSYYPLAKLPGRLTSSLSSCRKASGVDTSRR